MARAASKYKQVRITLTESPVWGKPDRRTVTLRVLVKPVDVDWTERHTVLVDRRPDEDPIDTLEDVYAVLLEFLAAPPLPGHIG